MNEYSMKKTENSRYLVARLFWKVFPVQFFLAAILPINALIDNLIASNAIGPDAVAGVALFSPLSGFLNGVSGLFAVGGVVVIIKRLGRTDNEGADSTYSTILVMLIAISMLFTAVMLVFTPFLAGILGGGGNQYLIDYIRGIAVFQLAAYLSAFLMNSLQVVGGNKRAAASILAMAASNVAGDILFVVILKMGTYGLGLATSLSYIIQFAVLIPLFIKSSCPLKFSISKLRFSCFPELCRQGLPSALVNITFVIKAFAINFSLLSAGGSMAVAAGAVQNVICWFLIAVLLGVGQTTVMLMSLYVSEEDKISFKNTFSISLKNTTIISAVLVVGIICFSKLISGAFFDPGTQEYSYALECLLIVPYFVLPGVLLHVMMSAYQALGFTNVSVGFTIAENAVAAGSVILFSMTLGVTGVWAGILMGEIIVLIMCIVYSWISGKSISFKLERLLPISERLNIDENKRLSRTIYSIDGAIGLSEDICEFCKTLNLEPKKTMTAGLAIEEISVLMFQYGLNNIKDAQADVRVIHKGDELIIRFRDNGKPMFAGDRIEIENPDDPAANMGIKMLIKMSTDITSSRIMGLNVITFKMSTAAP